MRRSTIGTITPRRCTTPLTRVGRIGHARRRFVEDGFPAHTNVDAVLLLAQPERQILGRRHSALGMRDARSGTQGRGGQHGQDPLCRGIGTPDRQPDVTSYANKIVNRSHKTVGTPTTKNALAFHEWAFQYFVFCILYSVFCIGCSNPTNAASSALEWVGRMTR